MFPWLFLLLPSVSLLLSFPCNSVLIRGKSYAYYCSSFRVSASAFSYAYFRVIPCNSVAMLMLLLSSVANLLLLFVLPPVLTRGYFFIKKIILFV